MVISLSFKIILIIGILIFVVSTVGFGTDLSTVTSFNNIGAENNVSVPVPNADITNVVLTESVGTIVSATITVKNTDSTSHAYKICVITKAGTLISDIPGTSSDCTNTASISASNTGSSVINFANPLSSSDVDYSDISIQQII
jgi:hypothetical protein